MRRLRAGFVTPLPGGPEGPPGGHYDPSASGSLDWNWPQASSQEARATGACAAGASPRCEPRWSTERRPRSPKGSAARRIRMRLIGAPSPHFLRGGRRGEDGVPGTAKPRANLLVLARTGQARRALALVLARAGARTPLMSDVMSHYAVPAAIVAVAIVLVFGLYNMMRGGSPDRSQKLMRLRVLLQFVAIIVIMATVWMMKR